MTNQRHSDPDGIQSIDIDTGKFRASWQLAGTVFVVLVSAGSWFGAFIANSAKKSEVAPVTVVARVESNERAVLGLQRDVSDLQVDTREVSAKMDMLIQAQWIKANDSERARMRSEGRRIAEASGADPLSGVQ